MTRRGVWFTSGALWLAASSAWAGGTDTYNAPVSGGDLLQIPRAHAETGDGEVFGRLSLAYNKDPVIWRNSDGSESRLLEHQFGAYAALGLSLWERFQIAALVPVYYQTGQNSLSGGSVEGTALGDAALDLRVALLGRRDIVEFALAGRVTLPTGDVDRFVSDDRYGGQVSAILSREFGEGGVLLTSRFSLLLRNRARIDDGTGAVLGLGAAIPLVDWLQVTGEGELSTDFNNFFRETSTPASLLGGFRGVFKGWNAHIGAGPGLTQGLGTPDFRVLAMVGTASSLKAEPAPVEMRVVDTDGDGIDDNVDQCPTEAEDFDGFADEDGCPDQDNDKDGILDKDDKCPNEAEDLDGHEDEDGCPDQDNDKDGIPDTADRCPMEAETVNGIEDEDGCPEVDTDGDGILDPLDKCVTEQETFNGIDDEDGCPDLLRVEQAQIRTLEPIFFDTGSDRIQARSMPLLQELASVIANRPDLGSIAIEGHTDNVGSEQFNLNLSRKRAESVRRILIQHGVPEARLSAAGFGEMRPITSNETPQGREQNRRVEFRLADVDSSQ